MSTFPPDLRYTSDHEWLRAQGSAWRVGITQFPVDQPGHIKLHDPPTAARRRKLATARGKDRGRSQAR